MFANICIIPNFPFTISIFVHDKIEIQPQYGGNLQRISNNLSNLVDPVFPFVVEDFFCIALNIQEECAFGLFLLYHMLGKENFAGGYKMFEAPMTDQFLATMFQKDV